MLAPSAPSVRAQPDLDPVVDAKDAWRRHDRDRLAAARAATQAAKHSLASWVEYWDMNTRLVAASPADVEAFYAKWRGTYVEDRLRNDWLLELGRRRDWATFAADFPRFRMNDDRDVTCYARITEHLAGKDVHDSARDAWLAQRDADDACSLMAQTLYQAKVFSASDIWHKANVAIEAGRPKAARQAVNIVEPDLLPHFQAMNDNAARFLTRQARTKSRGEQQLVMFALMRLAASDPVQAAQALQSRWAAKLAPELAAWTWAAIARQSAMNLSSDALEQYERADKLNAKLKTPIAWPDGILAWKARAALRGVGGQARWSVVAQAIDGLSSEWQRETSWTYWKARALLATAEQSKEPEAQRALANSLLEGLATRVDFYGALAAEQLGRPLAIPAKPQALTEDERAAALNNPGLQRGLQLIGLGLRGEGVREWNYTLRGMSDRELLAAAQMACDRQVWDRCINTSDRTQSEVDMAQRFPTPFRNELVATAGAMQVDPATVFGLIRQESRFVTDARSSVGASGLMQLMPATARWTARKLGIATDAGVGDPRTNLRLGTGYLKLVLEDFDGSLALAAAAYNAGPSRSRRWRDGPVLETAVWAENIPFSETRDYVKKVLLNATYYAHLLSGDAPQLKKRLGPSIGPKTTPASPLDAELP